MSYTAEVPLSGVNPGTDTKELHTHEKSTKFKQPLKVEKYAEELSLQSTLLNVVYGADK